MENQWKIDENSMIFDGFWPCVAHSRGLLSLHQHVRKGLGALSARLGDSWRIVSRYTLVQGAASMYDEAITGEF